MKESKIFTEQNLTEKFHYVYRATIDEKYYIGKRTGCLNDLHTGRYKTSSNLVHEKLKNGHHFSKIKIIQVFSSSKDALEFESRILTRVDAKRNPKFLNQTNGGDGDFTCKQHTEKSKEKISKKSKEYFNPDTEEGRKNRENVSKGQKERHNPDTEEGRKRRENKSQSAQAQFDPNTEEGRKNREHFSEIQRNNWDKNTEEGRKRREQISNKRKEKVKEHLQNRKDTSILGDLMFDEDFIRQNLLITDDKNNLRFLWSVYSKLTGYKKSSIIEQKREGKLNFLYGIESISITEELENSKIREIEAIIKSRNDEKELSLKAS